MSLTLEQVTLIRTTAPLMRSRGDEIATALYDEVFDKSPVMNNIFNRAAQDNGHQIHAVAMVLYAYASHIDNLGKLSPAFEKICSMHASMFVQPDQYVILGNIIILAMARVLKDEFTPELMEAWTVGYRQLADIFIANEARYYEKNKEHEWEDWQEMTVVRKIKESDVITSFYFQSADARPLPPFRPGQFTSVNLEVPKLGYVQSRPYSLSQAPGRDTYRISVKRESGVRPDHPGYVSNILHDDIEPGAVLRLSHPQGKFFLDDSLHRTGPIVLLSAGVGITPVMSMLDHLLRTDTPQPLSFFHGSRSINARPFHEDLSALSVKHPNLTYSSFVKNGSDEASRGPADANTRTGRLQLEKLDIDRDLHLMDASAHYFVCGPSPFMSQIQLGLVKLGVDDARIHQETFGPEEWPEA